MTPTLTVRLGTRSSALATAQSQMVARDLEAAAARAEVPLQVELVPVRTRGDVDPTSLSRLGGTGVFAATLREALLAGGCDLAVHSFKDLPTAPVPGLTVAAVPLRQDPRDALCARPDLAGRAAPEPGGRAVPGLSEPAGPAPGLGLLPPGARVGTGSPRRAAQLLAARPDLQVVDLRGNVPTRLSRVLGPALSADGSLGAVQEPDLDAVVLALAGLRRLRLEGWASLVLAGTTQQAATTGAPLMLPAPAQGALAVETRTDVAETLPALATALAALDDPAARAAAIAERAVLAGLQAGCAAPVGALAQVEGQRLDLEAAVVSLDGARRVTVREQGPAAQAATLGARAAAALLAQGAAQVADLQATRTPRHQDPRGRA